MSQCQAPPELVITKKPGDFNHPRAVNSSIKVFLSVCLPVCFPIGAVCSGPTLFASILNSSVMLGNDFSRQYFQMHFFLGALRVNFSMDSMKKKKFVGYHKKS